MLMDCGCGHTEHEWEDFVIIAGYKCLTDGCDCIRTVQQIDREINEGMEIAADEVVAGIEAEIAALR